MSGVAMLPRIRRALWALAAAFGLVGAAAWAWRAAVPEDAILPEALSAPAPAPGVAAAADPSSATTVVVANVFSAKRSAPVARYDPLAPPTDPVPTAAAGFGATVGFPGDPLVEPDAEAVPRLYGTIVGPQGAAALLQLDPNAPGARLYRVGERGGEHRVVAIEARSVVLSGPEGRITLTLPGAESRPPGTSGKPHQEIPR